MTVRAYCADCRAGIHEDPDFDELADLQPGVYSARLLNPPSGDDCDHLLVRDDGSLGWCDSAGEQVEDARGYVSRFDVATLIGDP